MSENLQPPKLVVDVHGHLERSSLADQVEWFINFDERTARMRHPEVEALFQWKQGDDQANGIATYPFETAEARFAIGVIQAIEENSDEQRLKLWMSEVLNALQQARDTKADLTETYKLDAKPMDPMIVKAEKLTTNAERRTYLTSCWFDALFTAEARVLGWVYQELFGKPFRADV